MYTWLKNLTHCRNYFYVSIYPPVDSMVHYASLVSSHNAPRKLCHLEKEYLGTFKNTWMTCRLVIFIITSLISHSVISLKEETFYQSFNQ